MAPLAAVVPRSLDVQKFAESRAPELESLQAIIAKRTHGDLRFQRNKRKRTTSHNSRDSVNRNNRKRCNLAEACDMGGDQKKLSRKMRRKKEFQKNPVSGFIVSGDGTKRLRTHLWHAKRFTMVKRWGFYLPLGLQGRGRGSRAVLKWLKSGALVHDASYCCPVQLEGPEESLSAILRMVLVPFASDTPEERTLSVFSGIRYESAMLHHIGAPISQAIAPVTYMWRPFSKNNTVINLENGCIPSCCSVSEQSEATTSYRQLWIWIHAAGFNEGLTALRVASEKQMSETGVSIRCFSLEGQLAELEVMGLKASQILQKILCPVSGLENTIKEPILRSCSNLTPCTDSQSQKSLILEYAEHMPSQSIVYLQVQDPRDLPFSKEVGHVPKALVSNLEGDAQEGSRKTCASTVGVQKKNTEALLNLWSNPVDNSIFLSDSKELWDSRDTLRPPIAENILCAERYGRRLKTLYLDNANTGTLVSEVNERIDRSCSILLVKHDRGRNFCARWSILLPLSWVKAFWVPIVSCGAHAIGLRERRWITCDDGLPSYPYDFPDCKAYTTFLASEAAASDQMALLRPLAMRPFRVPILPPWHCVMSSIEEGPSIMRDCHVIDSQTSNGELPHSRPIVHVAPESCASTSGKQDYLCFKSLVARTFDVLNYHLENSNGSKLLLFPNSMVGKTGFGELVYKGRLSWALKNHNNVSKDRELCFLRVLLHAYKEGIFEEGAVVCAPTLSDLSHVTGRSEVQVKLQIHESLMKTYFTMQDYGRWELQVPVVSSARKSYRWPIGFVTSGFVKGSKKPVAEAFCEATLLAQLREQQWSEMKDKGRHKIYLLVRNLRSTTYRLALATIILEQQKEDLDFM